MEPNHFRAVICGVNSKYIHSTLAPWYLAAGVTKYCLAGITAQVVEGTVNEDPLRIVQRITDAEPQVVGFSCYIWNIVRIRELIRLVKQSSPNAVIVLGGPEVSYRAEDILREEPLADFVIAGEGELPFAQLLNALYTGNVRITGRPNPVYGGDPSIPHGFAEIPGLCYRKDADPVLSVPHTTSDEPPDPYTEEYFNALHGRIAYLETSRGCPFSCAFCLSGRCCGVRCFPIERAKAAMLRLANSGARTVKLVDRTFNANPARARELLRFLCEEYGRDIPAGVRFHFEVAGDLLDPETLRLLAAAPAGLFQLEIGLQSFHAETLAAIHRRTDTARLICNIRQLMEAGNVHIHIDLIAGLPLEDLDKFAESFDTAYDLKPHMLQLGFLKLLHGAPNAGRAGELSV